MIPGQGSGTAVLNFAPARKKVFGRRCTRSRTLTIKALAAGRREMAARRCAVTRFVEGPKTIAMNRAYVEQ